MKTIQLHPLDVIVVRGGTPYFNPLYWATLLKSDSHWTHSALVATPNGGIYDPTAPYLFKRLLKDYHGRYIAICRYCCLEYSDIVKILKWCKKEWKDSKGFDYMAVIGFLFNESWHEKDKWYCAQFCYHAFQDNGAELTKTVPKIIYPRFFVDHPNFNIIAEGELGKDFAYNGYSSVPPFLAVKGKMIWPRKSQLSA